MRINPDNDAFPTGPTDQYTGADGINIRTYIATTALQTITDDDIWKAYTDKLTTVEARITAKAKLAVELADALIAELNKE